MARMPTFAMELTCTLPPAVSVAAPIALRLSAPIASTVTAPASDLRLTSPRPSMLSGPPLLMVRLRRASG